MSIHGFWLSPWQASLGEERRQEMLGEVMGLLADGTLTPYSGENNRSAAWLCVTLLIGGRAALHPACMPPSCPPTARAGARYPLEKVGEAVEETTRPQRGGKCFLEG